MHSYALSESHYVDAMQGIATIKINNREAFFDKLNKHFYSNFQEKMFCLSLLNNRFNFFSELLGTTSIITVFGIASFMVLDESMRLGEVIAILSIVSGLMPSINRLTMANIQIQEARIAFERMHEFASVAPENDGQDVSDAPDTNTFTLEIKNLSFRFPGQKLLLTSVSFSIHNRGMIALLGESGSGKSTLMQILQKFYEHESGFITFNGRPLREFSTTWWRNILGVVPQDIKIFNGGLLYNIALSDHPYELEKALQFCKESGFSSYFEKLPQGYLSLLGEEGINISGGQKQLVALARALYKKPRLLILDEATAAMDKCTERFILDLLMKLRSEISIILVTHKMDSASLADKVYLLGNGIIRESQATTP
jgi:ATP-binding cassette subfamily B protein